jgi:RNA recognition motif-containing protein
MKKVYVGNLPYNVSEQDLEGLFSEFGIIVSSTVIKDFETGRSKGFGFIEFDNQAAAQAALKLDGQEFQGRRMKVNIARDKREGGGSGGGRGGRSGGGGRSSGGGRNDRPW